MTTATAASNAPACLAHTPPDPAQIQGWVDQFNREGFLFLRNVLTPAMVAELKADLDRALAEREDHKGNGMIQIRCRMFETSPANVRLFELEPIVSFAEALVAADCHVFHNNGFRTPPGGGLSGWHQDDQPHYRVTHGEPPTNITLPCLFFTANYYLTDVETVAHGPTQVIPGSHLFGAPPPNASFAATPGKDQLAGTKYAGMVHSCLGPAGSVVMFNNQVWHRGAPNASDRTRCMAQVSYGRRIIGPMYYPFMNYVMPEHVYRDAGPRLRRLLGFKPSGAYG